MWERWEPFPNISVLMWGRRQGQKNNAWGQVDGKCFASSPIPPHMGAGATFFITPLSQAVSSPGASPGSPIRQDSTFFWSMVSPKGLWKLDLGDRHLFIFSGCFTEKTAAEFPKEGGSSRKKKKKTKNNPETRFPNIYFNRGPGHYYTLQPWPDPQLSAAAHPSWHQHGAGHWLEEIWGFSGRAGTGQGGDCLGGGEGGAHGRLISHRAAAVGNQCQPTRWEPRVLQSVSFFLFGVAGI